MKQDDCNHQIASLITSDLFKGDSVRAGCWVAAVELGIFWNSVDADIFGNDIQSFVVYFFQQRCRTSGSIPVILFCPVPAIFILLLTPLAGIVGGGTLNSSIELPRLPPGKRKNVSPV